MKDSTHQGHGVTRPPLLKVQNVPECATEQENRTMTNVTILKTKLTWSLAEVVGLPPRPTLGTQRRSHRGTRTQILTLHWRDSRGAALRTSRVNGTHRGPSTRRAATEGRAAPA